MTNNCNRAAVLVAPGTVAVEKRPRPEIGPRQVRIRLEGCGVCGSNLPVWEGRPWFTYPLAAGAPGHEGWGWIDEIGSEVEDLRVGQRVAVLSYNAFADYDVADADRVVPLPAALDGRPFPGEALGCAMNVFQRCAIQPQHRVAVVGVGFMGALLVRLAAHAGAEVVAFSRRRFARETAVRMGARETVAIERVPQALATAKEITGGRGFDRVIEATGFQEPLDLAGELTAERGRLIIAGYHQDGARSVNMQLWNWRGIDVINAHERDPRMYVRGMRAAAAAVASGELDPAPLYTDSYSLEQLPSALDGMRERSGGFLKSIVTYA
jgi:threonine dehydrogenase-like Zn-dependent dehydrogenase